MFNTSIVCVVPQRERLLELLITVNQLNGKADFGRFITIRSGSKFIWAKTARSTIRIRVQKCYIN